MWSGMYSLRPNCPLRLSVGATPLPDVWPTGAIFRNLRRWRTLSSKSEGLDVYTGGVDAYSTLGWFDDSLLSTVVDRSDYQLAGLVFHELAHQVAFAAGDTSFNESFATAVEREGIRRWSESLNDKRLLDGAELSLSRQSDFVALVTHWRSQLHELYESELPDAERESQAGAAVGIA